MRHFWLLLFAVSFVMAEENHWSYEIPKTPKIPEIQSNDWVNNEIDFFIFSEMEKNGLSPSVIQSPERLIRRLYLDLVGLPPSINEVDSFLLDPSITQYGQIVDKLLKSKHFGEKWAIGWLDLARYADSDGYQRDGFRNVWPYRDWVIRSLNEDMPYDQFTIEQIAGDLIPNATESQKIATGFNRGPTLNLEAGTDPEEDRIKQVVDRVNTTATVWLGTSLECAQCHDHKHDPFSIKDYYSMFAFFNNTPVEGKRRPNGNDASMDYSGVDIPVSLSNEELLERKRAQDSVNLNQTEYVTKVKELCDNLSDEKLSQLKEKHPKEVKLAKNKKISYKDALAIDKVLFKKSESSETLKKLKDKITKDQSRAKGGKFQIGYTSRVMKEMTHERKTRVLIRGDFTNPGVEVIANTPTSLPSFPENYPKNRLGLARWIVSHDNPLTSRVAVNRVWAELFGSGIVTSIEDFGYKGVAPSHPDLLDWLAVKFQSTDEWSLKKLIKRIVLSSTYRQSSKFANESSKQDPLNQFYSRGPRNRLPAELIRDNALTISGLLSKKMFGRPVRPKQPNNFWRVIGEVDNNYYVSEGEDLFRRGIYTIWRRSAHYPSFANFDAPTRGACSVKRESSNTPLQALTLLNDPVFVEMARAFSRRIMKETSEMDTTQQLDYAFRLALSRSPSGKELEVLKKIYFTSLDVDGSSESAWFEIATTILNLHETITK